jgi:TRAP-type mannitol/chloroaromatic compound transport system substrate-binding protein
MERRQFLKAGAIAGTAAAATTLAAPAISQGMKEFQMVTSWPKNFPGLGTAAARFGDRVAAMSDGKMTVKLFAGGELVHPLKCHDAVQEGTADMYHSAEYYYQGKALGLSFFAAVPFGLTPAEMNAWIHHGGGQQIWDDLNANFGIKNFACGNTGSQMGGWFAKPVTSLDDFKGLKMRIPGVGGRVIEALGGSSITLGGADIMPALQAGTIDATEWVGPWNDLAFGFYKVVKFYHYPGFHEPGTVLSCGINKDVWDGLSASEQAIIENAATAENSYGAAEFNANNGAALDTLITEHGVELVEFSDEIFTAMGEAAREVMNEVGKTDADTKKVFDSYMAFRKNVVGWSKLSDQSYMNKRALVDFH